MVLIIRKYRRDRSNKEFWECKIIYKDPFSNKTRSKVMRNFRNRLEAERAAEEILFYLEQYK